MDTSKGDFSGAVVYVGPNLPGLGRHTVFTHGVLPHVRDMLERSSALKELFVPVSQLNEARQDVVRKGTRLHSCADRVLAEFKR